MKSNSEPMDRFALRRDCTDQVFATGAPWIIRGELHVVLDVRGEHVTLFNPRTLRHRMFTTTELETMAAFKPAAVVTTDAIIESLDAIEQAENRVREIEVECAELRAGQNDLAMELGHTTAALERAQVEAQDLADKNEGLIADVEHARAELKRAQLELIDAHDELAARPVVAGD